MAANSMDKDCSRVELIHQLNNHLFRISLMVDAIEAKAVEKGEFGMEFKDQIGIIQSGVSEIASIARIMNKSWASECDSPQ